MAAQETLREKQAYARSAGFAWLLGRKAGIPKPSPQDLAIAAFGALDKPADAPTESSFGPAVDNDNAAERGDRICRSAGPSRQQGTKTEGYCVRGFKNGWYTGETREGCLDGQGTFAFLNGEKYEGGWSNNRMSGRGRYVYKDGSQYEGEYMAGRKHGLGRFTPAQGEAYMIRYEHGNMVDSGDATIHADDANAAFLYSNAAEDWDGKSRQSDSISEQLEHEIGVGITWHPGHNGDIVVAEIQAGSSAWKDKRIQVGDRLIAVNRFKVVGDHLSDIIREQLHGPVVSTVELELEHDLPMGVCEHNRDRQRCKVCRKKQQFVATLTLHGRVSARDLLRAQELSAHVFQVPANYVEHNSNDDSENEEEKLSREAELHAKEEEEKFAGLDDEDLHSVEDAKMTMEGVVLEVRRVREFKVEEEEEDEWIKLVRKSTAILGLHDDPVPDTGPMEIQQAEEGAGVKTWGESEDDDEDLPELDLDGDIAVPPEMVHIYLKNEEIQRMSADVARKDQFQASLLAELVHVIRCPYSMLSCHSMVPAEVPAGLVSDTELLGQVIRFPDQLEKQKGEPGHTCDKNKLVSALRVGLLISIRGTEGVIPAERVSAMQREKAEWISTCFEQNERTGIWPNLHYLSHASKIDLVGPWDLRLDKPIQTLHLEGLREKQFRSLEETRAIWSHRFMKRYGNPTMLVLPPKQRLQVLEGTMKAISGAEVSSSNTFVVRKRLNAFEDGPRVFILDLQEQCIVNEIYTDLHDVSKQAGQKGNSKKAGINSGASKVRKKIPFEIIKQIIPHETNECHVTMTFKSRQRNYDFDFALPRNREVFVRRLREVLPESCFAEHRKTEHLARIPNYYDSKDKSAMRSNISVIHETGQLPWKFDRFGNPVPILEVDPLKGRIPHPEAEMANEDKSNAMNAAIPPNAITPGLSNQQAAYVQRRPDVAESFYGNSVYRSAMMSMGASSLHEAGDILSASASRAGRSHGHHSVRQIGHYLGDERRSVRSGFTSAKTPLTAGGNETLASYSVGAGLSVRGQRHGEVNGVGDMGEFTNADHVIAFKLVNRIPEEQQLTEIQVKEAVFGQYAELAVKQKMMEHINKKHAAESQRKMIFHRMILSKGYTPSQQLLQDVQREITGLEETKRFRHLIDLGTAAKGREQLAFPLAYPLARKTHYTQEEEEAIIENERALLAQRTGSEANGSRIGSQSSSPRGLPSREQSQATPRSGLASQEGTPRENLRHPILGEKVLEARMPGGHLCHDQYLILSHVTKQPMMKVQRNEEGILFVDPSTGTQVASLFVPQEDFWTCTVFGDTQEFSVQAEEQETGHKVYKLRRFGQVVLIVSWIEGTIHFKTPSHSIGNMRRDAVQGKWTFSLHLRDERYPFFLLWGAGWAAQKINTPSFDVISLPNIFPKFW